jgi:mannosylglycerate hydrolase
MTTRPLPAGPENPLEGPQLQGRQTVRYVVHAGDRDPYAVVDDAFVPLLVATGDGGGTVPDAGRMLAVDGAQVSSLHRDAGQLVLRVFNPTDQSTTVTIEGRHGWLVDLRGRPIEPFERALDLAPHQIATLRLVD